MLHHSAINSTTQQGYIVKRVHMARWGRGGYHYFIERSGLEHIQVPIDEIAYHAGEHNLYSVGICLAGDFRYQHPTAAQIAVMSRRVLALQKIYGIPNERVFLHRELRPTTCPIIDLRKLILYPKKPWADNRAKRRMERLKNWIKKSSGRVREMYVRQLDRLRRRI